jgi:hypothetical protein
VPRNRTAFSLPGENEIQLVFMKLVLAAKAAAIQSKLLQSDEVSPAAEFSWKARTPGIGEGGE